MAIDFETARTRMVDSQLRTTDVSSHAVLEAFRSVAREDFVPAGWRALAYMDADIRIGGGGPEGAARYLMAPSPLARLLQLADARRTDVALEIGCGAGYVSALLSLLVDSVVALESDPVLAREASDTLARLGYDNVAVITGNLADGCPPEAPYDVIFVNGAVEALPERLFDQLNDGGRLVAVEGHGNASCASLYVRKRSHISVRSSFNAAVKLLPGFERTPGFVF